MSQIKIILGPPGTGKTTTLLNLIDSFLLKGTDPKKIGFISFTKKSVTEAKERAATRFNKDAEWFYYFRTIHSLCFRQLAMSSTEVMQRNHYRELGEIIGFPMTGIHRQDQMIYEMSIGDQMVFIESLSRMTCEKLEDTWNRLGPDLDLFKLQYYRDSLVKYKRANILKDFTDMLEDFLTKGTKPKLDVLFVDEAQDLCQLQWRIVESLMNHSKETYIAGDDDQAIFRWSGADIDYFLNLPKKYETTILNHSFRLPVKIHSFSQELVNKISTRNVKKFTPANEQGEVSWVSDIYDVDLDKGEWLILVRNSFLMQDIIDYIRSSGYAYSTPYYSLNEDEAIKNAVVWEHLRKGGSAITKQIKDILALMSNKRLGKGKLLSKGKDEHVDLPYLIFNNVIKKETADMIWHEAMDKIPDEDREYYISVRRKNEKLTGKPRIKISTIHGAKGGECENVLLCTDMSMRTYRGMQDNPDDEYRVFYVAATRAKKNLYIVQNKTINFFQM